MMQDAKKTKAQLLGELAALRQRVAVLEAEDISRQPVEAERSASENRYRFVVEPTLSRCKSRKN